MSQSAYSDDEEDRTGTTWTLGFVEEPDDPHTLLRHRFRSKVGGRPAWLNPLELPRSEELRSKIGAIPLNFLLQVYCPLEGNISAFHRSLYLFVTAEGSKVTERGAMRAFRCQLPLENAFYASSPSRDRLPRPPAGVGPEHADQDPWHVLAWEASLREGGPPPSLADRRLFPEWSLAVEEESGPRLPRTAAAQAATSDVDAIQASDVTPDVEAAISSATTPEQKLFAEFAARVSWDPEQVLRYCVEEGAEPLWPSPYPVPSKEDIPCCQNCKGPRRFEFEVLPQLLNHLDIDDEKEDALDWGAIAVYTCAASCTGPRAYMEEFVWVQA